METNSCTIIIIYIFRLGSWMLLWYLIFHAIFASVYSMQPYSAPGSSLCTPLASRHHLDRRTTSVLLGDASNQAHTHIEHWNWNTATELKHVNDTTSPMFHTEESSITPRSHTPTPRPHTPTLRPHTAHRYLTTRITSSSPNQLPISLPLFLPAFLFFIMPAFILKDQSTPFSVSAVSSITNINSKGLHTDFWWTQTSITKLSNVTSAALTLDRVSLHRTIISLITQSEPPAYAKPFWLVVVALYYIIKVFNFMALHYQNKVDPRRAKKASSIQNGYRKCGTHARGSSRTLSHSKIELRQRNRGKKYS